MTLLGILFLLGALVFIDAVIQSRRFDPPDAAHARGREWLWLFAGACACGALVCLVAGALL